MTCTIEGCESPHLARGWCRNHYNRWHRTGSPNGVGPRTRPECSVADCGQPHEGRGYCHLHYERWKRSGTPEDPGPRASGANAWAWSGDSVGYSGAHRRVQKARGSAQDYECSHCGDAATDWAYDHTDPDERFSSGNGPYSIDAERYLPLCSPCHKKFDAMHKKASGSTRVG